MPRIALLAPLLLAACQAGRPADRHDDSTRTTAAAGPARCAGGTLSGAGVGALRIGAAADSVTARCTVVRDTTAPDQEGHPARTLDVVAGADTVHAEIADGRVWRIQVTRPAPRTADGLGVGTPLARLLDLPGARGNVGEGTLFVTDSSHCGLSFQLSENGMGVHTADWTAAALRRLPAGTVVTRVLAFGCGDSGRR